MKESDKSLMESMKCVQSGKRDFITWKLQYSYFHKPPQSGTTVFSI